MSTNPRARALYVIAHAPSPAATQAGHRTAHEFLTELRSTHDVDTVVLCNSTREEVEAALRCTSADRIVTYNVLQKALGVICGFCLGIPPRFSTRLSLRAVRVLDSLIVTHRYSLVWAEFSQASWLILRLSRRRVPMELVLSLHDLQIQVIERKSPFERRLFLRSTGRYERKVLHAATRIRIQSNKDADLVRGRFGRDLRIEVKAPTLSPFVQSVRRSPQSITPYSLLFWGAMNRPENHGAVSRFAQAILPRLVRAFPSTRLFVVGANPPPSLQQLASGSVTVTGFVEDPTNYFEAASLGVVPLLSGAGIKVKTLEMLAAGLTVVSTPIGAEGIEPSPRLIVTEFDRMADIIVELWQNAVAT